MERQGKRVLTAGLFIMRCSAAVMAIGLVASALAQGVPPHAEGLVESLVTVSPREGLSQSGVLSLRSGAPRPLLLAVLLPGSPSVVRPVVENGVMVSSRLTGNFLIRARRHLADDGIATLVVDCISDSGDSCSTAYQASPERQKDVQALIDKVLQLQPSLQQVWLVGTSLGTVSSVFMARFGGSRYAGVIHTASITAPRYKNMVPELVDFDYAAITIPQVFVHHRDDPCPATPYAAVRQISERYAIPLVTVTGGTGFTGGVCQARTQHGFQGREEVVMHHIAAILKAGKATAGEL